METDTNASALFGLDGGSFDLPVGDQMDLFDFFINTNDLPDFITAPELPLPDSVSSSSETTPNSSPVSSPPAFPLGADSIKNEPLSPGQTSDGGSSGDEASCYVELSKISPVKVEPLNYQGFVNPASLDVKFCNEPAPVNTAALSQNQQRRNLKRRREPSIKPTMADKLFPGMDGAQKQISPEEERELKKQKRLIKNRESAQKSRQRRKAYIEELEHKVSNLTGHAEQLAQENKVLKEDLAYLLNVLKKTPGVPTEVLSKTSSFGASPATPIPVRGVKAAGVCLLIVLFSFGLFFNAKNGPSGPSLPFDPNTPREPIPEVLPTNHYDKRYTTRMLKSLKDAEFDERRELLEIFPERGGRHRRGITIKTEEKSTVPLSTEQSQEIVLQQPALDRPIKKEKSEDAQAQPRESPCIKKQKKSGNWTKTAVPMDVSEDSIELVPTREGSFVNPRTSYFFCSDAREVMVGGSESDQTNQPRTVSLLVPLEAFNGTAADALRSNTTSGSPALVEVACQVLNMNVYTHAVANGTISVS